jgi:hypothetical protein
LTFQIRIGNSTLNSQFERINLFGSQSYPEKSGLVTIANGEVNAMKKISFLALIILFSPIALFAQGKIEAPVWNIGDKWYFTGGSIEVVNADQNSYTVNFSDDTCVFQNQGFKAIIFEKPTLNRIGVLVRGNREEYTMGLRKILNFPLNIGKQWKNEYSGKKLFDPHKGEYESYTETVTVLGWADVEARAGKFRAVKLEHKHVTTASTNIWYPLGVELKSIFWYSPAVKYFIKCQYDKNYPDEVKNWELTSFKGKK